MRNRARHRASGGSQLFSFLDAMICTMGALLVLVHAFARHGEVEATRAMSSPQNGMTQEEMAAERENIAWRISQLKEARTKTEAQLADERSKLSHVEDHQRRLLDHLNQLRIAAGELDRVDSSQSQKRRQDQQQLDAVKQQIEQAQQALDEARRKAQQRAVGYAVVPYEGPNTTHRRPVYIECREDSIILQPEGVKILPEDFSGILGPGNPLASALRGMSEYFARQSPGGRATEEPYPLLLVRPDGIETYYAARAALDSWGSDFGYELIGADWTLQYPAAPDPQLATLARQIVADARIRMQQLAAALPQTRRSGTARKFHASARGGFVAEGGSRDGGGGGAGADNMGSRWASGRSSSSAGSDGSGGDGTGTGGTAGGIAGVGAGRGGGGFGSYGTGNGRGLGTDGTGPGGGANGANGPDGLGGDPATGGQGQAGGIGPGGTSMLGASGGGDSMQGAGGGPGAPGSGNYAVAAGQPGQDGASGAGTSPATGGGKGQGNAANGSTAGADAQSGQTTPGTPGGKGQYGPGGNAPSGPGSTAANSVKYGQSGANASDQQNAGPSFGPSVAGSSGSQGSSSGSAGSAGGSQASGNPYVSAGGASSSMSPSGQTQRHKSLAKTRGRDWGLPEASESMVPATRPVRVELYNDHVTVLPDDAREFVGNVQQHMKRWGPAGKNTYWRPTLSVEVKPGAADRYADLKDLLADSGLDMRERQPSTAKTNTTKKTRK